MIAINANSSNHLMKRIFADQIARSLPPPTVPVKKGSIYHTTKRNKWQVSLLCGVKHRHVTAPVFAFLFWECASFKAFCTIFLAAGVLNRNKIRRVSLSCLKKNWVYLQKLNFLHFCDSHVSKEPFSNSGATCNAK